MTEGYNANHFVENDILQRERESREGLDANNQTD